MALIRRQRRSEGPVTARDFEIAPVDWFAHADLDGALPDGDVVVPLARLERDRDALSARASKLGVRLPSDTRLERLAPFLPMLTRIEVELPKFTDGRGYTLGRRLRDQGAFAGELVAVGDVLRDQILYLHRSGFDVFAVPERKRAEDLLRAFDEMSVFYQAAHDQKLPLFVRVGR